LCTDNGAMIAWAGLERLRLGLTDGLDAPVHPRWPLGYTAGPRRTAGGSRRQRQIRVKRLAVVGAGAWGNRAGDDRGASRCRHDLVGARIPSWRRR
jgi:hypothetical protein